jgi:hypothetical protein
MLLSIDQKKIDEQLANAQLGYTVSSVSWSAPESDTVKMPELNVGTTIFTMPPALEESRNRLLMLRDKIVIKGKPPMTPEELEHLVDETRGR